MLCETPTVARAALHPVAMWLISRYLGVRKLKFSHTPSFTILKPAQRYLGKLHKYGWHVVRTARVRASPPVSLPSCVPPGPPGRVPARLHIG